MRSKVKLNNERLIRFCRIVIGICILGVLGVIGLTIADFIKDDGSRSLPHYVRMAVFLSAPFATGVVVNVVVLRNLQKEIKRNAELG